MHQEMHPFQVAGGSLGSREDAELNGRPDDWVGRGSPSPPLSRVRCGCRSANGRLGEPSLPMAGEYGMMADGYERRSC